MSKPDGHAALPPVANAVTQTASLAQSKPHGIVYAVPGSDGIAPQLTALALAPPSNRQRRSLFRS